MLLEKLRNRESGIVLYGITPPKSASEPAKIEAIASKLFKRLEGVSVDGLVVYDIQDEAARIAETRPFPYLETVDPFWYCEGYLEALSIPKVIYRAVGKYQETQLQQFLQQAPPDKYLTVFVGAAAKAQRVTMSLPEAYRLRKRLDSPVTLGGVVIPERHKNKGDEHLRVFRKIESGCTFFVSQGVYDVNAAKNFLSEYFYYGQQHDIPLAPIIFTFTPCGSTKTLQFMKWLGIDIPKWLENDLRHSHDILQSSIAFCEQNWRELQEFAARKHIPIGCNIESVAIRKAEIEASIELLKRVLTSRT
ncbi:MAG: methylenetetrahydrofolate reductase [Chloroflexales bacterium]|nr:methylenetetrahydrofolate reductase [Chloroflexales bacterium]